MSLWCDLRLLCVDQLLCEASSCRPFVLYGLDAFSPTVLVMVLYRVFFETELVVYERMLRRVNGSSQYREQYRTKVLTSVTKKFYVAVGFLLVIRL